MIRTSTIARSVAKQFGRPVAEALFLVQAAKRELEISSGLLTEKQAAEIERIVSQSLRAK